MENPEVFVKAIFFAVFLFSISMSVVAQADLNACKERLSAKMEMNLISSNIANLQTTKTPWGGPYHPFTNIQCVEGFCSFDLDQSVIERYEPGHPDANEAGFVRYPNINLMSEMESMIAASRRYEAAAANCPGPHTI